MAKNIVAPLFSGHGVDACDRALALASCLINLWAFCHTPSICNLINCFSDVHSFIESDLSDTDKIVPFENTTPINQNKKVLMRERRVD